MGFFSKKTPERVIRPLPKIKQLERRVVADGEYDDGGYEESDSTDIPGASDYVKEFKEGIDEISELFMSGDESGGDKFGKLSFGLANLCNYRNTVFDDLVSGGMSESRADNKLKSILVDAGFNDMMLSIVSFREAKKKRGRKKAIQ